MNYLYLINDILFNSQNTKIKYAWIYKELIQKQLPLIFHFLFYEQNEISQNFFFPKIKILVNFWFEKKVFPDNFYNGLFFYVDNVISDSLKNEFSGKIKPKLDIYENYLLELYTKNEKELREVAKENGINDTLQYGDLIEKLLKVKEMVLYKECLKECDGEECDEEMLTIKIEKLTNILKVMKKGYQNLNMLDVDGVEIDKVEYDFFGLVDNDDTNENEIKNSNNVKGEPVDIIEDIDGEPL